ncbi:GMC family oxidoreductase [Variovorax sp. dw_308]|uniref:GMC family oxidoreductase n=1 Tax=Variovorax sp. dw_308 TaxID=2721546 RepID=UPI001C454D2D|nr:GMC family oxidoreductase N-terminal domain-containing protein [Variovorax sp. dw_308]
MHSQYDYIIVGGGSAGCVLAARLSESPGIRVLLCEAGKDLPLDNIPPSILDSYPGTAYLNPSFMWAGLRARPTADRPADKYDQARILGGGSSINGQFFNRGAPADYDEWERRGAAGWRWDTVLPWFRKAETDLDFDGELHGKAGPIQVRRIFPQVWPGHAKAVGKAFESQGFKYIEDQNGAFTDGYFPIALSNKDEKRVSVATAYLNAEVRGRKNLTIATETTAARLTFDGTRCTGVELQARGQLETVRAKEVILSAGAIHSPAILLRSGIGPGDELAGMGVPVVKSLRGVGKNLMEHPSIALASYIKRAHRISGPTRHHIRVGCRYSSGVVGAPSGDMLMLGVTKTSWHAVGERIGTLLTYINNPFSASGEVTLDSPDWRQFPSVSLGMLSDERDIERLTDGFVRMAALQASSALSAITEHPFLASYGEKVRQIGMLSKRNKVLTDVLAACLDGPAPLRKFLFENVIRDAPRLADLLQDPALLRSHIRKSSAGVWHVSCTCRMGAANDAGAVTDSAGRVHGVHNLRVVDASIFPVIPGANTNAPTIMVAERIAAGMLDGLVDGKAQKTARAVVTASTMVTHA